MSDPQTPVATSVFPSALGWFAIQGTERGLTFLTFGHPTEEAARATLPTTSPPTAKSIAPPDWMKAAETSLQDYARGLPVNPGEIIPLDIRHRTPFEARVREKLLRLGYGQTMSYGELAEAAGKPRAARAVGSIMAKNPIPLVIPCHRVLGAGGRLGGYSAPSGLAMKTRLLQLESTSGDLPQQLFSKRAKRSGKRSPLRA